MHGFLPCCRSGSFQPPALTILTLQSSCPNYARRIQGHSALTILTRQSSSRQSSSLQTTCRWSNYSHLHSRRHRLRSPLSFAKVLRLLLSRRRHQPEQFRPENWSWSARPEEKGSPVAKSSPQVERPCCGTGHHRPHSVLPLRRLRLHWNHFHNHPRSRRHPRRYFHPCRSLYHRWHHLTSQIPRSTSHLPDCPQRISRPLKRRHRRRHGCCQIQHPSLTTCLIHNPSRPRRIRHRQSRRLERPCPHREAAAPAGNVLVPYRFVRLRHLRPRSNREANEATKCPPVRSRSPETLDGPFSIETGPPV